MGFFYLYLMRFFFTYILLSFSFNLLFSQINDSIYDKLLNDAQKKLDSLSLKFLSTEHIYADNTYYLNIGNIFSPEIPLLSNLFSFQFFPFQYKNFRYNYLFEVDSIPLQFPLTQFKYTNGQPGEQTFNVSHLRKFKNLDDLQLHFFRTGAKGLYAFQAVDIYDFKLKLNLDSTIKRNDLKIYLQFFDKQWKENGGLSSKNDFYSNFFLQRELIPVVFDNINDFTTSLNGQNFLLSDFFHVNNQLSLFFKYEYFVLKKQISLSYIDTSQYQILTNSVRIRDKIFFNENVFESGFRFSKNKYQILFGAGKNIWDYNVNQLFSDYSNDYVFSELNLKHLHWNFKNEFTYYFNGFKSADVINNFQVSYFKNNHHINSNFIYSKQHFSPYYYSFYSSINQWFQILNVYQNINFDFNWKFIKEQFTFNLSLFQWNNPVYFDINRMPLQYNGNIKNLFVSTEKQFNFFGNTIVSVQGIYQKNTLPSILHFPEFIGKWRIYQKFRLFKKAMNCLAGIDGWLFSSFESYGYDPFLTVFYNVNNYKSGSYPMIDLYFNANIKRMNVFVKLTNVYSFIDNRYMFIESYPAYDAMLKIGIRWSFLD